MASPPESPPAEGQDRGATPEGRSARRGSGGGGGAWQSRFVDESAPAEEKTYALFTHLVGLLSLASLALPVPGLVGTLIMWRIKHDASPFLDDHGREAVNFQISVLLYGVILTVLIIPTLGLSAVGHIAVVVLSLIGCIRGAVAANRGEFYRYPMTVRFLKGE